MALTDWLEYIAQELVDKGAVVDKKQVDQSRDNRNLPERPEIYEHIPEELPKIDFSRETLYSQSIRISYGERNVNYVMFIVHRVVFDIPELGPREKLLITVDGILSVTGEFGVMYDISGESARLQKVYGDGSYRPKVVGKQVDQTTQAVEQTIDGFITIARSMGFLE